MTIAVPPELESTSMPFALFTLTLSLTVTLMARPVKLTTCIPLIELLTVAT